MLRITVEIVPGGRESGKRTLAVAEIANVSRDCTSLADYKFNVSEEHIADTRTAKILRYPRWSSSVWDLAIRGIAKALTGKERLPLRPALLDVPIHNDSPNYSYVLFSEIPEPACGAFRKNVTGSTTPRSDGAYAHDWLDFLAGRR